MLNYSKNDLSVVHIFSDGGRAAAGYKGFAGDCVVRSICIAFDLPYQKVYDDLHELIRQYGATRRGKTARSIRDKGASPRNGISSKVYHNYILSLGAEWVAQMQIGTGCNMHLKREELPKGRIIARLSHHLCAVIDGIVYDTHDPSRSGTRCVYGYYQL